MQAMKNIKMNKARLTAEGYATSDLGPSSTDSPWQPPSFHFEEPLENVFYKFEHNTTKTEPKITSANPEFAEQGAKCQRLNCPDWSSIKFADVQKQFKATPVFSNLKINSILAIVSPSW